MNSSLNRSRITSARRRLSAAGFAAASLAAVLLVLAFQANAQFFFFIQPGFLEPIFRGAALVLVLAGCQLLVPGTAGRTARQEAFVGSVWTWAAMWVWPTALFSIRNDMLAGLVPTAIVFAALLAGHGWCLRLAYPTRVAIGLPLVLVGLTVPSHLLKRFLVDLL